MTNSALQEKPVRINDQLLSYWNSIKPATGLPKESEIDPDLLAPIWNSCFLIHIDSTANPVNYTYVNMGKDLVQAYGDDWSNRSVCEALVYPHPAPLLKSFETITKTREPIIEDNEFKNMASGMLIKYRCCLVPLSKDKANEVAYILGGMKWKAY